VKVTIAGADVSRYYNGDQFGRTSVQLSAFDLEVGLGTVVIPEIAGTDAFVTGRQCMVEQGTTVLVDGFLASDDRGRLETEPTKPRREWTMSLEDANAITSNIRAIDWTRSSETCTARILARISRRPLCRYDVGPVDVGDAAGEEVQDRRHMVRARHRRDRADRLDAVRPRQGGRRAVLPLP
jgi:hypothetical protein